VHARSTLKIDAWVLSCRAFARRIEYALLDFVFRELAVQSVELAYEATPRNGPIREFLQRFAEIETGAVRIDCATYAARSPRLFHEVRRQS
jgi:predicted enzyme involved in methoxymalonyl-ACP biosynthesis